MKKTFLERMFGKMMPCGAKKLKLSQMNMAGIDSKIIKGIMKKHNVDAIETMINTALENGVEIVGCQMTMDLLGIKKEELLDGVKIGGVATMLGASDGSNMDLFI